MDLKKDLVLPVITGILAIMAERAIYNRSSALRKVLGPQPADQ